MVKLDDSRIRWIVKMKEQEVFISKLYNLKISHNRIHAIMVSEGMSVEEFRKHTRKKWIRYERDYSNSLWHTDWHEIKDTRWKGRQLIAYEDDASRFIVGYGVFDNATSDNSVSVLQQAIVKHGRPTSNTIPGTDSNHRYQ